MLISVILIVDNEQDITPTLDRLAGQTGKSELIVVDGPNGRGQAVAGEAAGQVKKVFIPATDMAARFNAGAAAASGDVLFFSLTKNRLPPDAIVAIERNLKLLPQTIGGNFHLKFKGNALLAKALFYLLKWWRYRGSYWAETGIFVRRRSFEELGGFLAGSSLADLEFVRRLEQHGPTLYLPEAIIGPLPPLRKALVWLTAPVLIKLKR